MKKGRFLLKPIWGLALTALTGVASASPWPMFRGPNASGVSDDAHPPLKIGPDQGVLWKIEIPAGPSSPCVYGDRLYLTVFADRKLETRAYDPASGKLLWSRVSPAPALEDYHPQDGSPAAGTPVADADGVIAYFGSSGLVCYDRDGKEIWRHDFPVAQTFGGFGSGTSPILVGNQVILNRDVVNAPILVAYDRKTGRKAWETQRPDSQTSYGTPVLWNHDGIAELVIAGALALKGYDPKNGMERWAVRGLPTVSCTTPVIGDGMAFFAGWSPGKSDAPFPTWETRVAEWDKDGDGVLTSAEFGWGPQLFQTVDANKDGKMVAAEWQAMLDFAGKGDNVALAVKPGGQGDITETHVAWKTKRALPYVPSPLHYRGRLYFVKDGGLMTSLDSRTGEPGYREERIPGAAGSYYASPVAADERIYLASLDGKVTVIRPGGDKPEVLHQAAFGERISATPALVGDRLFLRTVKHLFAFGS